MTFSGPDDPYTISSYTDDEGNVHFVVSADVLAGGDASEVEAQVQRRSDAIREWMADFLRVRLPDVPVFILGKPVVPEARITLSCGCIEHVECLTTEDRAFAPAMVNASAHCSRHGVVTVTDVEIVQ